MLKVTHLGGGKGTPGPSITFITSDSVTTNGTSFTHSGVSFGAAAADRKMIIAAGVGDNADPVITSATIGGVSATIERQALTGGFGCVAVLTADVPTGTTGDVVINLDTTCDNCLIGIYRGVGTFGTVATDSSVGSGSRSVTATKNRGVAAITSEGGTFTWTGAAENYDTQLEGSQAHSGALVSAAGTVTADPGGGTNAGLVIATW